MTTRRSRSPLLPAAVLCCLFAGCLDQETTTTVNTDGTCERRIVVVSLQSPFPLHVDATWDTTRATVGTEADSVKYVLKKTFASFEDLAKEYRHSGDNSHFGVRVSLEKQFRWFFTYFDYHEAYEKFTRDTLVPPEGFLTTDEMARYTYGDTSKALIDKVEQWHNRNLFEIVFGHARAAASVLPDSSATLAAMDAHKDAFYHSLFENVNGIPQIVGKDGEIDQAGLDSLARLASRMLVIKVSPALRTAFGEGVKAAFRHSFSPESKMGWSFTNIVSLPGTMLGTNAGQIKNGTVTWKLDMDRLSFIDYEMHAESRMVNTWPIVVTGLVLAGLVVALVRGRKTAVVSQG